MVCDCSPVRVCSLTLAPRLVPSTIHPHIYCPPDTPNHHPFFIPHPFSWVWSHQSNIGRITGFFFAPGVPKLELCPWLSLTVMLSSSFSFLPLSTGAPLILVVLWGQSTESWVTLQDTSYSWIWTARPEKNRTPAPTPKSVLFWFSL